MGQSVGIVAAEEESADTKNAFLRLLNVWLLRNRCAHEH